MNQELFRWKRVFVAVSGLALLLTLSAGALPPVVGTGMLTSKEAKTLAINAKTPAEHMKLARHYTAKAVAHDADAKEHEDLAVEYKKNPRLGASKRTMGPDTAEHCQYYAEHCRKAAQEMRAMAAMHEEMAKAVK